RCSSLIDGSRAAKLIASGPGDRRADLGGFFLPARDGTKCLDDGADRSMLEKMSRRQGEAGLVGAVRNPETQQRIAAEFEEVIVHTHFSNAQNFRPNGSELAFGIVAWRDRFFLSIRGAMRRSGQCFAI